MGGIFSAHVTGNFVLFAAAFAQGVEGDDYLKIVTFPVFVLGVVIAVLVAGRNTSPLRKVKRILLMMTLLLLIAAAIALSGNHDLLITRPGSGDVLITMLVVTAMAMQNSIHHFIKGPMTTVMTGTVMNTTARLVSRHVWHVDAEPQRAPAPPVRPLIMIGTFALGCLIAGFLTVEIGLASIIVPAALLCLVTAIEFSNRQPSDKLERTYDR